MTKTVFAAMETTQNPMGGLPEFAQTALTITSNGCYWAANELKREHDRKIGVDNSSFIT